MAKAAYEVDQEALDKIILEKQQFERGNRELKRQIIDLTNEVNTWGRLATERRAEIEFLSDKLREKQKPSLTTINTALAKENDRLNKAIDDCYFYLQLGDTPGDKAKAVVDCAKAAYKRACDEEDARFTEKDED